MKRMRDESDFDCLKKFQSKLGVNLTLPAKVYYMSEVFKYFGLAKSIQKYCIAKLTSSSYKIFLMQMNMA
jgi:hypothetical protein